MSDMRQNSYNDLNVLLYCTYQISSPCKVITHLPWPIYLKKQLRIYGGGTNPIWGAMETTFHLGVSMKPPSTRLKDEKF